MKLLYVLLVGAVCFSCKSPTSEESITYEPLVIKCSVITTSKDSIISKSCHFRNHLFNSSGIADNKGRFSYDHALLKIENTDTVAVNNSSFFKDKSTSLEQHLNAKIKEEYQENLLIPEITDCMEMLEIRYYPLDEFGISFDDSNQMNFYINHSAPSACFNVSFSLVALSQSELKKYLE